MKEIGYHIFAWLYRCFAHLPVKKNHVFLVMTHDGSKEGNVGRVGQYMAQYEDSKLHILRREDTAMGKMLGFLFIKSYEMARSEYIFLDNAFLPMAYFDVRKQTKVIQLWHGTGTIKRFGQHVNAGTHLGDLEKASHGDITRLVVNSDATKELYAQCFGISTDLVDVLGLPRTDDLFKPAYQNHRKEQFYRQYPQLKDKTLVLYAPTFRDGQIDHPHMELDIKELVEATDDSICIGLRLHPFIADKISFPQDVYGDRVIDFSHYPKINTLLFVADVLMTDYSSIIFDYCALNKPMIFFAYDLEEFQQDGRGFYEDYESYVPGAIARTTKDVIRIINDASYEAEKIKPFFQKAFAYTDGKSTQRVVNMAKELSGK